MSPAWPKEGLVIACDLESLDRAAELVSRLAGTEGIVAYKVGFALAARYGLPAVSRRLRQEGATYIVYDHQKGGTDIPQMGSTFAGLCADSGVDAAILFPLSGPRVLEAFAGELAERGVLTIVGGHMTHQGFLAHDGGYVRDDAPLEIYNAALALLVTNFVVPGNQPDVARRYRESLAAGARDLGFWMPGIGRQGGDIARAADIAGSERCYPIVGTAICKSEDPHSFAQDLVATLRSARGCA